MSQSPLASFDPFAAHPFTNLKNASIPRTTTAVTVRASHPSHQHHILAPCHVLAHASAAIIAPERPYTFTPGRTRSEASHGTAVLVREVHSEDELEGHFRDVHARAEGNSGPGGYLGEEEWAPDVGQEMSGS
ncbi:hypothetical protein EVG20_g3226 [Dentipellis fragilis]|uniref:Uncharacterized protein n=1 Tax=Dentipellis fragilis TaxID=205917 RepID=A0A4Y9Z350_9AGAM|nr:hypothetical protein EVG20_g3226 [Dentipellis fragilis]